MHTNVVLEGLRMALAQTSNASRVPRSNNSTGTSSLYER
jgi:hypothetical protein